jgi:hypothetical protein
MSRIDWINRMKARNPIGTNPVHPRQLPVGDGDCATGARR